jgi:hypothetical protein
VGDTTKKVVIGAAVVAAVVVAYFVYDALSGDTEDRPPIVVNETSLSISNLADAGVAARNWRRDGAAEKWKMDHRRGKNTTGFAVSGPNCSTSGTEVAVVYASGAITYEFRFYLDPHPGGKKMEPAVDSPVPLASDNSPANRKTIRYAAAGNIVGVRVGVQRVCTFQEGDQPEIRITPQS